MEFRQGVKEFRLLFSGDAEELKGNKSFLESSLLPESGFSGGLGYDYDGSLTSAGMHISVLKLDLLTGLFGVSGKDQLTTPRHILGDDSIDRA